MLFNSLEFAVFLPLIFLLYWFLVPKRARYQNILLLISSYIFYGWWDWRFLILIFCSSILDYAIGIQLQQNTRKKERKALLWLSITVNIGVLVLFKYYNFFAESFVDAFTLFGASMSIDSLDIILPVGISFYTFQSLSYSIDVYQRRLEPTQDWLSFLCYVSFFPQLVAGPIERAKNLLPQFYKLRKFNYSQASDGMRQMLWGFFKKMVVADNCARYVNLIFDGANELSGSTLLLGALLFSFQIYCDFSGYSDIAIGSAKLFGFDFKQNFAVPYFSRNIAEFWRRWHMSLSTWFRDYLYIPLGGSQGSTIYVLRNIFIIFMVSGFWHGANWTFIFWGFTHALFFVPLFLFKTNRNYLDIAGQDRMLPSLKELCSILFTFTLVTLAWVFFRAETISEAFAYLKTIASPSLLSQPSFIFESKMVFSLFFIAMLVVIDWLGREYEHSLIYIHKKLSKPLRYGFYYLLAMIIFLFGVKDEPFIYFQF
ncbi:MBOAT family O-acyltransferase [Psychroserpens sp.]|uniref:MBOAT family O-acyltransferase n=1 Tax=Psychroserpens sp. TaxID=2020870 RepID=UPI003C78D491